MDVESLPIYFGELLKKERLVKGFSQESLAHMTGLDRTYISLLERGKRQPTLKTFFILSKAFEIPPEDLVRAINEIGRFYENRQG